MTRLVRAVDRVIGRLCLFGTGIAAILLLASLALVFYSVFMRYFMNQPIPWVDELVGYLLVGLVMLAAADALRRGEHIAVDLLTGRLVGRGRRIALLFAQVACLVAGIALVIGGWQTASFTKMLGILSTGYLAMPMHLPQMMVPIGGALLTLAALSGLLRMAIGEPPTTEEGGHGLSAAAAEQAPEARP
jgi:C4-dicarboxylate transporter, DctQ subunit